MKSIHYPHLPVLRPEPVPCMLGMTKLHCSSKLQPSTDFCFYRESHRVSREVLNLTRLSGCWDAGLYNQAGLTSLCRWDLPRLPATPEFDLGSTFIDKVALENLVVQFFMYSYGLQQTE